MRTLRLAEPPSVVGADLRASLFSLGRDESACHGVALVGCTPPGQPDAVDAVLVTPTGIVVLVGVDLPDPVVHLHAPLRTVWQADGWPLPTEQGLPNPAVPALRTAAAMRRLITGATGREDVRTVLAVGPYVERVEQPQVEARDDIRVVYPTPHGLLPVLRELTAGGQPIPAPLAEQLLTTLAPAGRIPESESLRELLDGERFPPTAPKQAAAQDPAEAATTVLPPVPARPESTGPAGRRSRWVPLGAYGLGALVFVAIVVVLVVTSSAGGAGARPDVSAPVRQVDTTLDGHRFALHASRESANCAAHAFGDVQQTLAEVPCTRLLRRAYTTTVGGKGAAVSVADLRFASQQAASAFQDAFGVAGSGGVTTLAADGVRWDGAPGSFAGAAYASTVRGSGVRVTAAVWTGTASHPSDATLERLADQALHMPPGD